MTSDPNNGEPLPLSLVAHTVFCPRRAWLEAAGEHTDTAQMASGTAAHHPSDNPNASRRSTRRAVSVSHRAWQLIGRCDTIREENGALRVTEHKATPVRRKPEVTQAMRIQLALQCKCLTDMGHRITTPEIYFTSHNTTVPVDLTDEDYAQALHFVELTRRIIESPTAPEPLVDDPRCSRCSHIGVCLPEERSETTITNPVRVPDPDGQIIHLATPGSRASLSKGRLRVTHRDEELATVPIERVHGVVAHGNIDISGALLRELLWRRLTTVWCTGTGRVTGWSQTANTPNGLARIRQHIAAHEGRLELARQFITAKIANQTTHLRRNGTTSHTKHLRQLQHAAQTAATTGELFGIEGEAAALYFRDFPTLIHSPQGDAFIQRWPHRTGRTALDPLNASLNYLYGIVLAETIRAITATGLDPHAGFLHSSNRNKPALALDLMEEFRAPLADAVVTGAINNGELHPTQFNNDLGSCRLTTDGRKTLIAAFERRIQTRFTHPAFGYRVTWRRAIEIQARMILGYIDGTQARYVGIKTR